MSFLRGYLWISIGSGLVGLVSLLLFNTGWSFIHSVMVGSMLTHAAMMVLLARRPGAYRALVVVALLELIATSVMIDLTLDGGQISVGMEFYLIPLFAIFMLGHRWAAPSWGVATVAFLLTRILDPHDPVDTVMTIIMGLFGVALAWVAERSRAQSIRLAEQRGLELEDALERAEEVSRLKSTFLATMSHEIRTPMNGVLGTGRALLDTPLNTDQRELTETLLSSGEGLLGILNRILDFSRLEADQMPVEQIPLQLSRIPAEVGRLFAEPAREEGIALRVDDMTAGEGWVLGDPTRIRQMLVNLVGNALKFTPAGGQVTVSLSATEPGWYRFVVTDTGAGVPPEKIAGLFEAFRQADASTTRRHGGTGLGLAICKRLAERMGGEIGVTSAPGEGSCFWFALPLPDTGSAVQRDAIPLQPLPAGARVLIVEDNAVNQLVIQRMLARLGAQEVELVTNGADAVARVQAARWDVILMDCYMPIMDGFTATRAIRALPTPASRTPIIALTASVTSSDLRDVRAAGMDAIVSKPIDPQALHAEILRWLASSPLQRSRA